MRRASWASTKRRSSSRGFETASWIAAFVISWNEVFAAAVLTIENRTLTAFLLTNLETSPLHLKFAGGFILVVPALIFIFAVR